ncbi:MAG: glycosyltransferase family 39 protein, partial [Verrucomicrobiae bacterium]|nr:glycosyltransferase family 39 protein [Verrucomicrobiae bacterium]
SIRTNSWVVIGLWYGAAINLALALLALFAWHFRPEMIDGSGLPDPPQTKSSRFGSWLRTLTILGAVALGAWTMWPRLDLSLWGDEEATTRRFIIGHVYRSEDGKSFTVKTPAWRKAIWNWDNGPNNHTLFNILARLSHGPADTSGKDPEQFYFSERRIRMPSFVATLLLIPSAAWLVGLLGFPRGAPLTAYVLALHPWIIRYGSDARGYALLMLLVVLTLACLILALKRPSQARWWIGFGLCEALLLLANLTGIYFLVPLNAAGLLLAWAPWRTGRRNPFKVASLWRFGAATLLGAMVTIQVQMPIILQAPSYFSKGRFVGEGVNLPLLQDSLAFWSLGTPWNPWEPGNPMALTWHDLTAAHPFSITLAAAVIGICFLAGTIALLLRPGARWWLLALLAPIPLMFLDAERTENVMYPWYSVGLFPLLIVLVGLGFGALMPVIPRWPALSNCLLTLAGSVVVVAIFAMATQAQREIIRHHPVEPLAESVRLTREVVNPFHPDIDRSLTLGFVHATRLYDPAMTLADNDEEFVAAIRAAEAQGKPLWVNAANLGLAKSVYPMASELVEDRDAFEAPIVLYGLQQPCTRSVFRYRPGGLGKFEAKHAAAR